MKKCLAYTAILFLMIAAPVSAEWNKGDKVLFRVFTGAVIVDCLQTKWIFSQKIKQIDDTTYRYYHEQNPIIDWSVKEFGNDSVYICAGGGWLLSYFIADRLKPKWRRRFLSLLTTAQIGVVSGNYTAGVGMRF